MAGYSDSDSDDGIEKPVGLGGHLTPQWPSLLGPSARPPPAVSNYRLRLAQRAQGVSPQQQQHGRQQQQSMRHHAAAPSDSDDEDDDDELGETDRAYILSQGPASHSGVYYTLSDVGSDESDEDNASGSCTLQGGHGGNAGQLHGLNADNDDDDDDDDDDDECMDADEDECMDEEDEDAYYDVASLDLPGLDDEARNECFQLRSPTHAPSEQQSSQQQQQRHLQSGLRFEWPPAGRQQPLQVLVPPVQSPEGASSPGQLQRQQHHSQASQLQAQQGPDGLRRSTSHPHMRLQQALVIGRSMQQGPGQQASSSSQPPPQQQQAHVPAQHARSHVHGSQQQAGHAGVDLSADEEFFSPMGGDSDSLGTSGRSPGTTAQAGGARGSTSVRAQQLRDVPDFSSFGGLYYEPPRGVLSGNEGLGTSLHLPPLVPGHRQGQGQRGVSNSNIAEAVSPSVCESQHQRWRAQQRAALLYSEEDSVSCSDEEDYSEGELDMHYGSIHRQGGGVSFSFRNSPQRARARLLQGRGGAGARDARDASGSDSDSEGSEVPEGLDMCRSSEEGEGEQHLQTLYSPTSSGWRSSHPALSLSASQSPASNAHRVLGTSVSLPPIRTHNNSNSTALRPLAGMPGARAYPAHSSGSILDNAPSLGNPLSPNGGPQGAVRQLSGGLAGMMTNAQIQEWMSQHAARMLLPRSMRDMADLVLRDPFRPPSALPTWQQKRPLSSRNGKVWTVTPPVLLNGRYPPPATARLLQDSSFLAGLLASLPGVNPTAPVITSVVTALQGHDVVVQDAKALAE